MVYNGCVQTFRFKGEDYLEGSLLEIPTHKGGDVIVVAGNLQRKEVVDMGKEFYVNIGYTVVWCMKYIFIPFGVAVFARIFAEKLLQPQPKRQKKKRSNKNRFN